MNSILCSFCVLVCCVNKNFAQYQYQSIYPEIYNERYPYPGYGSIFTSNALNFGRTPYRSPAYDYYSSANLYPSVYTYPKLTYDRYGRLVTTITYTTTTTSNQIQSKINTFEF